MRARSIGLAAAWAGGILVGLAAQPAPASSIGMNFTVDWNASGFRQDWWDDSLGAAEVAGAPGYQQAHWNNLSANFGALAHPWVPGDSIYDSNGVQLGGLDNGLATGVIVAWQSSGQDWYNAANWGPKPATPDLKLMGGFMIDGTPNPETWPGFWQQSVAPQVYVTGLSAWLAAQGATSYKVIVYTDYDGSAGDVSQYWLQEVTSLYLDAQGLAYYPETLGADLTPRVFNKDDNEFAYSGFVQIPTTANTAETAASGNYIVFTDLTSDNFLFRCDLTSIAPSGAPHAGINGLQIVALLPSVPTVNIAVTHASLGEPDNSATLTLTRDGSTDADLVVNLGVSGTATPGVDYTALPNTVIIPAGQRTATITVAPIDDALAEPDETVVLQLLPGDYLLAGPNPVTLTLTSDDVAPTVSIGATDPTATEVAGNTGTFTVTRTGGSTIWSAITVLYSIGGSATNGADYARLSGSVVIPANQDSATIIVTPFEDGVTEGPETVDLTIQSQDLLYTVGVANTASVSITDDGSWGHYSHSRTLFFGGFTGTTPVENLPVLVVLTPGNTNDYAGFAAGGADLRFSDSAGTQTLPHEIEQWDAAGTSLVWVKVPLIQTARDLIVMHWGNPGAVNAQDPAAVWTDYLGVYHFGQANVTDSSPYGHNGTDINTTNVAGLIGNGRSFNGTDAWIDLGSPSFMNSQPEWTLSVLINPPTVQGGDPGTSLLGQNDVLELGFYPNGTLYGYIPGQTRACEYIYPGAGVWHYVTWTYQAGTQMRMLVDGVVVDAMDWSGGTGANNWQLGIGGGVTNGTDAFYTGLMDEARFSGIGRTTEWIVADYASLTNTLIAAPCGDPRVDTDNDGDVDQNDFGVFQRCFTGTAGQPVGSECRCVDLNSDGFVTADEFTAFMVCFSGSDVPANSGCLTPPP